MVAQDTASTVIPRAECVAADESLVRAFDLLGKRWTGVLLGRCVPGRWGSGPWLGRFQVSVTQFCPTAWAS